MSSESDSILSEGSEESEVTSEIDQSEESEDEIIDLGQPEQGVEKSVDKEVKTVFTKLSENMYKEMLQKGKTKGSFEYFMNDYHLSRMMEREDKEVNYYKAANFQRRQQEFKDTVELKQQERLRKRLTEAEDVKAQNKLHKKAKRQRSPTSFYNDHLDYQMKAKSKALKKREDTRVQTFSYVPTITEGSRKINRTRLDNSENVFSRLYSEGNEAKNKSSLDYLAFFCPNKGKETKEEAKERHSRVSRSASRLHEDSKQRDINRKTISSVKPKAKKYTNNSSKVILLKFLVESLSFHTEGKEKLSSEEVKNILTALEIASPSQAELIIKGIMFEEIETNSLLGYLIVLLGLKIEETPENSKQFKYFFKLSKEKKLNWSEFDSKKIRKLAKKLLDVRTAFSKAFNDFVKSKKKPLFQSTFSFTPSIGRSSSCVKC